MAPTQRSHLAEVRTAISGLRTLHQAAKGLAVFFLTGSGIGAVLPYLTLFVKRITNCTDQQAQEMFMILMLATAITVLPFGWLADKFGTRRILFVSLILIGFAAVNALWVTTLTQVAVILAIAGLGNAAQSAAAYPLMTQLVPQEEVGFYTGLQTMALSIAQPFTVVITGALINAGSYRSIFAVCGIAMLLGIAVLAWIRADLVPVEIEARRNTLGKIAEAPDSSTIQSCEPA